MPARVFTAAPDAPPDFLLNLFEQPIPSPGTSWLAYESKFRLEQIDHVVHLKTLPTSGLNFQDAKPYVPAPTKSLRTFTPPYGEGGVRPLHGLGTKADLSSSCVPWRTFCHD